MKNKALMLTGLGLGSVLTLTAFSLVSANETSTTAPTSSANTNVRMMKEWRWEMRWGPRGGGMMFGGPMKENDAVQAALLANDYSAFQTAIADTPMADREVTQDEFTKMAAMAKKHQAAEQALASNDYNAYIAATQPTQDEFNTMVAQYNSRQAAQAAIKANDYAAFQTATTGTPMEGKVTPDQFNKMVERNTNK